LGLISWRKTWIHESLIPVHTGTTTGPQARKEGEGLFVGIKKRFFPPESLIFLRLPEEAGP
jgi:hypothetical protein